MPKILVTGSCGYIGSHTVVDLINNGYEVIGVDSLIRSQIEIWHGIEQIVNQKIELYRIDLTDHTATKKIFFEHTNIDAIIHFAGLKSVVESVREPELYMKTNLGSLDTILKCMREFRIRNLIFSSSCSVYGNADELPVTELTPIKNPESPYAASKIACEEAICNANFEHENARIILRYFNPAGSHLSLKIGEQYSETPEYLLPYITQTAIGWREVVTLFGDDYPTRDGTCIRDFVHVMDIAHAHTLALQHAIKTKTYDIFNLGTGKGVSVKELVDCFINTTEIQLNYKFGPRRSGDVVQIFADNTKATTVLKWKCQYTLADMVLSAWQWQLKLQRYNSSNV